MAKKGEIKDRTGESYMTRQGYKVTIIEYKTSLVCTVRFNDRESTEKTTSFKSVREGWLKNPNHKIVYKKGYFGQGSYTEKNIAYDFWHSMLRRCYSQKSLEKDTSYVDIEVCESWHNFQNFAKWFYENYVEGFQLDKDILIKGNKIYSPETCCFVPQEINKLFTLRQGNRGKNAIGVFFREVSGKYIAQVSVGKGIRRHIGVFNTEIEAFYAYKEAKEKYIKEVADTWEGQITDQVYDALYRYEIDREE